MLYDILAILMALIAVAWIYDMIGTCGLALAQNRLILMSAVLPFVLLAAAVAIGVTAAALGGVSILGETRPIISGILATTASMVLFRWGLVLPICIVTVPRHPDLR